MLSHARLIEVLDYDPVTGIFRWKKARRGVEIGSIAGCVDEATGYIRIRIDLKRHFGHRLAWFYVHGEWPTEDLDHRDLNKAHNAIGNLRLASDSLNQANSARQKNNTTGFKGVYWNKRTRKFCARIKIHGREIWLGYFVCPKLAHAAYVAAAKQHFGEFARAE